MKRMGSKMLALLLCAVLMIGLLPSAALADGVLASAVDPKNDPDNPTGQSPVRFSPAGGTYNEDQTVSLFCDEGWSILYTTDGSNPSYRNGNEFDAGFKLYGKQYSGPITVTENTTIKAAAYRIDDVRHIDGFSNIVTQTYYMTNPSTITVGSVTFSPVGSSYTEPQTVTLSCAEGWNILYTTDGSEPGYENTERGYKLYGQQYSGPITVTESMIIKAAAYYIDWSAFIKHVDAFSAVGEQTYYISGSGSVTVGNMNFSPAGGSYTEPQTVTLSCLGAYDGILYTTDGSQPGYSNEAHAINNVNGTHYSGPINVSESTTIRAVAYKENWGEYGDLSHENPYTFYDVVQQTYDIIDPRPSTAGDIIFSPAGRTFAEPLTVALSCTDAYDGILYTTDGSQPGYSNEAHAINNVNGTHYSGPINVSESTTIRAVAYKENRREDGGLSYENPYTFYDIVEQTYDIIDPGSYAAGGIIFAPGGRTFAEPLTVALSCADTYDGILYTIDGSQPGYLREPYVIRNVNGTHYSGPITVSESTTIKAVAYKENREGESSSGLKDENPYTFYDVVVQTYTILTPSLSVTAPTFDPVPESYAQPDAQPITIANTGTGAATIAAVMLTGANPDCFTLNTTGGTVIAAGAADDTTYTVQPISGLAPGAYTATITAYYDKGAKATADVTISVLPPALAAGENTVSFEAVYEEQLFRFTPSETGVYRSAATAGALIPPSRCSTGAHRLSSSIAANCSPASTVPRSWRAGRPTRFSWNP